MASYIRVTHFQPALQAFRAQLAELAETEPLASMEEALAFINRVGLCLLLPDKRIPLPDLASRCGENLQRWRDDMVSAGLVYYGRPYRRRAGFVSLDLLQYLYAISPTGWYHGDRFELHQQGYLSREANRVAGVVLAKGPLPTRALRRECGLASAKDRDRFKQALIDAQRRFLIVGLRKRDAKLAPYTYVWDAFGRVYSGSLSAGLGMAPHDAGLTLIRRYVEIAAASPVSEVVRLFQVNRQFVDYVADKLVEQGSLYRLRHKRVNYLLSAGFARHIGIAPAVQPADASE